MDNTIKSDHLLEVDSVMVDFGGNSVLSDIAFSGRTGEILGFLGLNGSGKSTLMKVIFGSLHTFNKNIKLNSKLIKGVGQEIGYLPQHAFLPSALKVKSLINQFVPKQQRQDFLCDNVIKRYLSQRINQLSVGERRYLEVVFLISRNYKFLLLDEPFSAVEPKYKQKIIDLLHSNKERIGFLVTDHDYSSILESSDRIFLLKEGRCLPIAHKLELEDNNYVPAGTFKEIGLDEGGMESNDFEVDKQTLQDIDLEFDGRPGEVMRLFMGTQTEGGRKLIRHWMLHPQNSPHQLTKRVECVGYFSQNKVAIEIPVKQLDFINHYKDAGLSAMPDNALDITVKAIRDKLNNTNDYYLMNTGVDAIIDLFRQLKRLVNRFGIAELPEVLSQMAFWIEWISRHPLFQLSDNKASIFKIAELHNFFISEGEGLLDEMLEMYYMIDAYNTIAKAAKTNGLTVAEFVECDSPLVELSDMFHPLIDKPVCNSVRMDDKQHFCFLTGANMAGKSTFLKSYALCIYLAHAGFPVPARQLKLSLFNGLITTINLSDNINKGYSHFYSEVKRVKEAAMQIAKSKSMVVIFDELFRGTNVKDASDASLMISSALANVPHAFCLVSTHIVEIAEELKQHKCVSFKCFEIDWENDKPFYNYILTEGISKERLGMYIVKNAGIMDILERKA